MLIATGIMAIGLVLVATIFPVGVKLTTMTTERSIAAVTADEAFAKIQLYGIRDFSTWPPISPTTSLVDFMYVADVDLDGDASIDINDALDADWADFDYDYPSDPTATEQKYCWSALCHQVNDTEVQVTVFINRMTFGGVKYYGFPFEGDYATGNYNPKDDYDWPTPVRIAAVYDHAKGSNVLTLQDGNTGDVDFVPNFVQGLLDEGYTIVNDRDGKIYQIDEMKDIDDPEDGIREIILRQDWQWQNYDTDPLNPPATPQNVDFWVVPPGVGSSRYPCVGVFQKVLRLE